MREGPAAPTAEADAQLSRRTLIVRGAGVSGALVAGAAVSDPAWARSVVTRRRTVWGLDPAGNEGCKGCKRCKACRNHAANKMFPTAAAADRGRAHPHCRCRVVKIGTFTRARWRIVFIRRDGTRRASVDRRRPWMIHLLNPKAKSHFEAMPSPTKPALRFR